MTYLEEDDDETGENLIKMSSIDLPHIINNKKKIQESTNDKSLYSDNIVNNWIMEDTIKKRIGNSSSKIIIL